MDTVPTTTPTTDQPVKKNYLVTFFLISLGLVCLFSFLRFYLFKNYDIIIETECDPNTDTCFTRDCETEECPPNNLNNYKKYSIKAFQFDRCDHAGSCVKFCSNIRNCEPIECDTEAGDVCLHN